MRLPEWLTDSERLAMNIYYTTAEDDAVRWQALSGERQEKFREMALKIISKLPHR